ncbi:B12-binding domain-containing radical SAM protein [Actinomadura violacea]|uniref:Uncharacterized protein n=1 Tax=Actinomadura violacea TaxID=2819934 RepID=A0ABS3RZ77_9ACTN|nr:hypothetical protein [Actinomadura violacea]MBO2461763.1 hypothetical protein [Actinomadura violacea]
MTVAELLLEAARRPFPWCELEDEAARLWPGAHLGGDPLRPYAVAAAPDRVRVVAVRRDGLPDAPLVAELLEGSFGLPTIGQGPQAPAQGHRPAAAVWEVSVAASEALAGRLRMPEVLLIGLGDRDRYRGARLPLGVARLASWLRWTHAGRVTVIDYALTDGDPLESVRWALTTSAPQVIGVGVNFGQWGMLAELAEMVEEVTASWERPPVVVLGNILAAFSPHEAAQPFKAASAAGRLLVATGLGERPLQALCRSLQHPAAWAGIPGLIDTTGRGNGGGPGKAPELVAPDDALVLAVARRGGQVSLETSLGCQYGACTFCPRSHKGHEWVRTGGQACVATLERWSQLPDGPPALSVVDEEFFGADGLIDPSPLSDRAAQIMAACRDLRLRYEIYTRLEQLFDRRRSRRWNLCRARLLAEAAPHLGRLFVGVESGSPSQLRRYGKGQTLTQTVDALQVASHLGVPLEFGFITFDPLLTAQELAENLTFLARTDVMCQPSPAPPAARAAAVGRYLTSAELPARGEPLYQHVAYMATELEVLANSRYADSLQRRHPDLIDGYDSAFARYTTRYTDPAIDELAGWCRVWTEGMFAPVYQARMSIRSSGPGRADHAQTLVRRYRDATFTLLLAVTARLLPALAIPGPPGGCERARARDPLALLTQLSAQVLGQPISFDPSLRERRRER